MMASLPRHPALSMAVALGLAWAALGAAQAEQPFDTPPQTFDTPPAPPGTVIYVTSQGLYYDSLVLAGLPQEGRFQKLEMGTNGLQTEFGPGDPGYLGGRWWVDANGNDEMDDMDMYFLCPLLAPGRPTP